MDGSADIIDRMHDYKTESSMIVQNLKFWLANLGDRGDSMQESGKILEEIDIKIAGSMGKKRKGLLEARDIISKHMDAGWIPVEEDLPPEPPEYVDDEDDLKEYIVMIDGAEMPTILKYAGDGTWWEDGTYYPVIAWRPLPEPYRPERSET